MIRYRTYVDRSFHTTYLQNRLTGKLKGRKRVPGRGDGTTERRVSGPKDYKGQILGRTESIPVRGSGSKRGTTRRSL